MLKFHTNDTTFLATFEDFITTVFVMIDDLYRLLFNVIHRLYARILFARRVHSPWKLLASTRSAFSCPLSCENTVSTRLRSRNIS